MALHDFTFYDLINRNAVCFGNQSAWLEADDNRSASFLEIKQQADRLAAGLQDIGVRKGDVIAVLGKNSLEYFLVYGAAAAVGAIVLPVNWRLSPDEVAYNLNDCGPLVVFADPEFQDTIEAARGRLTSARHFFGLRPAAGEFQPLSDLMNSGAELEPATLTDGDGLVIIHTAAVAGRPRGALLTHRNFIAANVHLNWLMQLTPADVHLNILPLFHVGGLFMATKSFHAGAMNINMSKFDATRAVELIESHRVTVMFDFAPILASVLDEQEKSGRDIGSPLRLVPATEGKRMQLSASSRVRQAAGRTPDAPGAINVPTTTSSPSPTARIPPTMVNAM